MTKNTTFTTIDGDIVVFHVWTGVDAYGEIISATGVPVNAVGRRNVWLKRCHPAVDAI